MKKTTLLKNLINNHSLEFLMEAHNGLSAKIVEEAGFKGIWASGLAISASLGVRDNNEASWTQILEVLEFMSDNTTIPILLDGDTGYGNFNNARRLVRKLEQRNIAGVCIEDKLFPKTNSFIQGEMQPLADIDEFCGKIQAMKDSQKDPDFIVVARTEAFIAGWGLEEALKRAEAYRKAGADAILVHSKKSDISDIERFMKVWKNKHPIIIVPTKYYSVSTEKIKHLGVSAVIWANHNIRVAIDAMQKISKQIYHDQSIRYVESKIASVEEIFRLQGAEELKKAEKKYLPTHGKNVNAIILAASQGELNEITNEIPKTLVNVNGKSLIELQLENFHRVGIKEITVVRGFAKEKLNSSLFNTIDNQEYENTTELYSLYLAMDQIKGDTVISYGDILFKNYVLHDLLNDNHDITLVVDADIDKANYSTTRDWVIAKENYSKKQFDEITEFVKMTNHYEDKVDGEFIGLWKVSEKGAKILKKALETLSKKKNFKSLTMLDLFNYIGPSYNTVKYIKGSWLDVDTIIDLQKAGDLF